MFKKKIKVAVIDSGIDTSLPFFKDKDVLCIKVDNNNIVKCKTDTNGHGTLVGSYILRECEDVGIVSIQILNEHNKSNLDKLIKAIYYCIENEIDIINLSLGMHIDIKKIEKLKSVCLEATSNGILIFSAHSNIGNVSYPASFNNVIGIGHDKNITKNIFKVDKDNKNIFLSRPLISMNHFGIDASRSGNSFLCPYIVGVFCRYINYYRLPLKRKNTHDSLFNFIDLLDKYYKDKIFNLLPDDLSNKKVLFYPLNKINKNIIESYTYIFDEINYYNLSSEKYDLINSNVYTDIEKAMEISDLFVIGNIDYEADREYTKFLIEKVKSYGKDLLIRYSFISTFDRYLLSKETGLKIYCQHL